MVERVLTGDRYYSIPEVQALILQRFDRIVSQTSISARWREIDPHRKFKRKRSKGTWEHRVRATAPEGMLL
jgi:hypothetical protein